MPSPLMFILIPFGVAMFIFGDVSTTRTPPRHQYRRSIRYIRRIPHRYRR